MNEDNRYSAGQTAQVVTAVAVAYPPVTMQMIDDDYRSPADRREKRDKRAPREPSRLRLRFSRMPAMILAGIASLAVLGAGAYVLPKAVAAKSTVGRLEGEASRLSAAYEQCAGDLKAKAEKIDTYTQSAVDMYNREVAECEQLRKDKKRAVDELNRLYGE